MEHNVINYHWNCFPMIEQNAKTNPEINVSCIWTICTIKLRFVLMDEIEYFMWILDITMYENEKMTN